MKLVVLVATAALTGLGMVGCSGGDGACASVIEYQGASYWETAYTPEILVIGTTPIGEGVVPSCDDGHGPASSEEAVRVVAIEGVSTSVAIGSYDTGALFTLDRVCDNHSGRAWENCLRNAG